MICIRQTEITDINRDKPNNKNLHSHSLSVPWALFSAEPLEQDLVYAGGRLAHSCRNRRFVSSAESALAAAMVVATAARKRSND